MRTAFLVLFSGVASFVMGSVVLVCFLVSTPAPPLTPISFEMTRTSYVHLEVVGGEEGSSWIGCGTEGIYKGQVYILTACHVAKDARTITVRDCLIREGDGGRSAVCIRSSAEADLALLWVSEPRDKNILPELRTGTPYVGQACWYTTSGSGVCDWTERGTVAKLNHKSRFIEKANVTLVTGMAWYGSSGGGVWADDGFGAYLIGVVSHGVAGGPRTPCGCPSGSEIAKFLKKAIP